MSRTELTSVEQNNHNMLKYFLLVKVVVFRRHDLPFTLMNDIITIQY